MRQTSTEVGPAPEPESATGDVSPQLGPEPAGTPARRPWLRHLCGGLTAVALYSLARIIAVWALYSYAEPRGKHLATLLTRADGDWLASIAQRGYDHAIPVGANGALAPTNLAFFPLYPALVRVGDDWLPVDIQVVQVAVAGLAAVAAAAGLYAIGAHLLDRRAGIFLAVLWGVLPHAIVETMGYDESLLTALSAWMLYAVLRRNWLTAGTLCFLAGLTHSTILGGIAAVGLAALVAVIRDWRQWRPWVAMVLAPLGTLGYLVWLASRLGRWDAYVYLQREAWHWHFDGGVTAWHTAGTLLRATVPLPLIVTSVVLLVMTALFGTAIGARIPWPLLVYAGGFLVLALGGDTYYWAKARTLLPAFPLLIPIALGLARSRNPVVAPAVLITMGIISTWYGVFLLAIWRGSP